MLSQATTFVWNYPMYIPLPFTRVLDYGINFATKAILSLKICVAESSYSTTYRHRSARSEIQRWSPRGHILKSLALASKVKSLALASRPQVLENWPVLGSRTALFFELLKFCEALEKFLENVFLRRSLEKFLWRPFFLRSPKKLLWRALALVSLVLGLGLEHSCPWPRECLSSERLSLALASDFFCVLGLGLGLEPCVLDSTSAEIGSKRRTESLILDAMTCWWIGCTELTLSLWNASVCVVETVV